MRNSKGLKSICILIIISFCILTTSCISAPISTESPAVSYGFPDDPAAVARQATVDALSSLISGYTYQPNLTYDPKDSARQEGWLDVNQYFSILTHLSMQPGYVLDYVYHNNGSGAQPYLYARKIDNKPFNSLEELRQTFADKTKDYAYDYLGNIQTDNTEESFFQFIALRIMGDQFYLWWHANYKDYTIICDHKRLESLFSKTGPYSAFNSPVEVQNEARQLDLAPKIKISQDDAAVRIVIFTKWGGFIEEIYTISRTFPHIIDSKTKTLVPWQINLTF